MPSITSVVARRLLQPALPLFLFAWAAGGNGVLGQALAWAIDPRPKTVIGGLDSDFAYIIDAEVVPGVGIFVASPGRVLLYDDLGTRVGTVAQEGHGPGDLISPVSLQVSHDSLFVLDSRTRRISVFGLNGELVRSSRLNVPFSPAAGVRLSSGEWLIRQVDRFDPGYPRLKRDTVSYFLLDGNLGSPRLLTKAPGVWGAQYSLAGTMIFGIRPFSPQTHSAALGTCILVTSTDEPIVRAFSSDGSLRGVWTFPAAAPQHVDSRWREYFIDRGVSTEEMADPSWESYRRAALRDAPFMEEMPLVQGILVDPQGLIWMQAYSPTRAATEAYLMRLGGAYLGRVTLPEPMRLLKVGVDYIVGVTKGSLDEEYLRVYGFQRARPNGEAADAGAWTVGCSPK